MDDLFLDDPNNWRAVPVGNEPGTYLVWCVGCRGCHRYDGRWSFNGDYIKPTFKASMIVTADPETRRLRCHSYVTDGKMKFLADCEHDFAGKVIDIPPLFGKYEDE